MVLLIMLHKAFPTFGLWMTYRLVNLQMKATEQYVPATLFILFHKKLPTFESVDEILTNASDHSNESY